MKEMEGWMNWIHRRRINNTSPFKARQFWLRKSGSGFGEEFQDRGRPCVRYGENGDAASGTNSATQLHAAGG